MDEAIGVYAVNALTRQAPRPQHDVPKMRPYRPTPAPFPLHRNAAHRTVVAMEECKGTNMTADEPDPIEAFRRFAQTCDIIQQHIVAVDNEPHQRKALRLFGLREACRVLDADEAALRGVPVAAPLFQPGGRIDVATLQALRLHVRRPHDAAKPPLARTCVLAVANFKGGAAKSSTSVHLAQHLVMRGFRVLLVDLDSQATATSTFGFQPDIDFAADQTLWSFLRGDRADLGRLAVPTHWPGLDLLPANLGLYQSEFELPARQHGSKDFRFWQLLRQGIESLGSAYDVVLCDCPPSLGYLSLNAIYAATAMIVPCPASMVDFASTGRFFAMLSDTMEEIALAEQAPPRPLDFTRILITRFSPADRNQQTLTAWLETAFPKQILTHRMVQTTALDLAGNVKRTLYELEPNSSKSLERAIDHLDAVNREIEQLIVAHDPRGAASDGKRARAA
jgi:chromosome partitioning protein